MNLKVIINNLIWMFLFILLILGIILFFTRKPNNNTISNDDEENILPTPSLELKYNPNIEYSAWIADWAWKDGVESLAKSDNFDSISPVWYELNEDGTLKDIRNQNNDNFMQIVKSKNIKLIPTIANFDHEKFHGILQNQESFNNQIDGILYEVNNYNYDGIDLDYESIQLDDKKLFFDFLKILSSKLQAINKKLIVTVVPKWSDEDIYKSLRETRQVQDWTEISKYADEIRIMTYDYTFSGSKFPGPIAPLNWMENVVKYALTKLPADKITLGIHLYSYEWWIESDPANEYEDVELEIKYNNDDNFADNSKKVRSYTYNTVEKVIKGNKGELIQYEGENIYTYSKINSSTNKLEKRVLVFIDRDGVKSREELAKKYGLKGVAYWRLGNEGDLLN
ncbi:hypothetical protein KBD45_08400 [Candidatus Dojkabacteria bacterium]|nr:hypothetical protein [Candidatus Dojkabacteria bacterium]